MTFSSTARSCIFLLRAFIPILWAVCATAAEVSTDASVDQAERVKVIDGALRQLRAAYVDPIVADKMEQAVRMELAEGYYDRFADSRLFAEELTIKLREVCHDGHLTVAYRAPGKPESKATTGVPSGPMPEREREANYGFTCAQILPGNVGFLDITSFSFQPEAGETTAAAMAFVASTDALIIDLRHDLGGYTNQCDRIASYLVDGRVHLYDIYVRESDNTNAHYTSASVPGRRFGGTKPLFILTSHKTYSCAEGFAFALRGQARVTIVGELTGGGAHTVSERRLDEKFTIRIPWGKVIVPNLKDDWEGVGIEPDVKVAGSEALKTAHMLALEKLLVGVPAGPRRNSLEQAKEAVSHYR
jgi:hypothetical protein